jgi:hypothetical protein
VHRHPTARRRDERGMATAELAVITPLAVAFAVLLIWAVSLGYTQVRLTDAAREAARLVARGESVQVAEQVALAQSPEGTSVEVVRDGDTVVVTVEVRSGLPGGWFGDALSRDLTASAVAALESP